ncbi:hypothetical protein NDK43_26135 [Neobacillus pocheonensis]|uniref:Uncharacterized protein n=1 Tax=Neobacillus pocheonensis TaxID=363869 RepID=A0ABT0WI37_9BACI|nr:hypothetical protein [Neobacillus pocheonensis]
MSEINTVQVYLEYNNTLGLTEIGTIEYFDEDGNEMDENEIAGAPHRFVGNEYLTVEELRINVANRLGIDSDQVEIEGIDC